MAEATNNIIGPDSLPATQRKCLDRLRRYWPDFLRRRKSHIGEHGVGKTSEVVARNIVQDLFTIPLDWPLEDLKSEFPCKAGRADIVLTSLGIPQLIVETKAPQDLKWSQAHIEEALWQVRQYGDELRVKQLAVSDGYLLYAIDLVDDHFKGRVAISLEDPDPPDPLWWLSTMGIFKPQPNPVALPEFAPTSEVEDGPVEVGNTSLLHPKYQRPAQCFAYVADATDPKTWKLPYRHSNGAPDMARLPKAIQAIVTDYRGVKVKGIPERSIPDVLVRLALAARTLGKLPYQRPETPDAYQKLAEALAKCGRDADVRGEIIGQAKVSFTGGHETDGNV